MLLVFCYQTILQRITLCNRPFTVLACLQYHFPGLGLLNIFNVDGYCQLIPHRGCTNLHAYQQCVRAGIRFDCCIFKLEIVLYSTFSLSPVLRIKNLRLGDRTKIMLIVSCSALAAQPEGRQNLRTPRCAWPLAKHVLACSPH